MTPGVRIPDSGAAKKMQQKRVELKEAGRSAVMV